MHCICNVHFVFQTTLTKDNILQIINYTVYLTSPKINLSEADIIYTADILYNFQLFEFVNEEVSYSQMVSLNWYTVQSLIAAGSAELFGHIKQKGAFTLGKLHSLRFIQRMGRLIRAFALH